MNPAPLLERIQNQEPASGRPSGVQSKGDGEGQSTPTLDDIRPEDLEQTDRLLVLRDQAIDRGLITTSEADDLRFVSAAVHAQTTGKANPCGLFAYLVRGKLWRYLTQEDEDRAVARLKAHDRAQRGVETKLIPRPQPTASAASDREVVRAVRLAMLRSGVTGDPWPVFQRRFPGWTRQRWDAAMVTT